MRDPERQNRLANSYQVEFPNYASFNVLPSSVTIHQSMGKHDVVELFYPTIRPALVKAVKTGSPIKITWANDKVKGVFYGYVSDAAPRTTDTRSRGTKVRCVGASYVLKQGENKIWQNKTAPEIVTEIAKKFKLKPVVTPHSTRFAQQSLAGQSYWQKIKELGDKIGYGYQVMGTELHFHPIDKMIDQFMTTIPVMAFLDPLLEPKNFFEANTLDKFEPTLGDYVERSKNNKTTKIVGGTDPVTSKVYKTSASPKDVGKNIRKNVSAPIFNNVETDLVSGNAAVAISLAKARAQLARLSIPANGVGQGDPRIAPWRTVEVRGTGEVTDGFWIVKESTHFLNQNGTYRVEFSCLADGTERNTITSTRPSNAGLVPTRNVANEVGTARQQTAQSPKLTGTTAQIKQTTTGFALSPQKWS